MTDAVLNSAAILPNGGAPGSIPGASTTQFVATVTTRSRHCCDSLRDRLAVPVVADDACVNVVQSPETMAAPVMRAWFAVSASEENLELVSRHYGAAPSGLPPTRLLVEWREAGHPEPNSWIRERLQAIVEDQAA
jgi:hypothetical protein